MNDKKIRKLVQTTNAAMLLHPSVFRTIVVAFNEEQPDACLSGALGGSILHTAKTMYQAMNSVHCRVFRRMLNITSFMQSKHLMNKGGPDGKKQPKKVQINSIYCLHEVCAKMHTSLSYSRA